MEASAQLRLLDEERSTASRELIMAAIWFDAEGSVTVSSGRGSVLRVTITQIAHDPLLLCQRLFGGGISPKSEGCNVWYAHSRVAARFLVSVLPYLTVKKRQAEIALATWRSEISPKAGAELLVASRPVYEPLNVKVDASRCRRGHRLEAANLYVTPDGRRQCRICRRASQRKFRKRRSAL